MQHRLYQLLGWLFFSVSFPPFFVYSVLTGRYRRGLSQRFGLYGGLGPRRPDAPRIWLHASSVGEVQVARALLAELRAARPGAFFIVSTMTETGLATARQQLGEEVHCLLAPLDLAGIIDLALRKLRPDLYICLETELWPNLLLALRRQRVPMVLLNGRLSDRSLRRYRLVGDLMGKVLRAFDGIGVIRDKDRERFLALGAEPEKVVVCGNAKYDLAGRPAGGSPQYRELLGLEPGRQVLVAGSTHSGEEEMLLDVYRTLCQDQRLAELVLVLAPRHLQRLPEIEALLEERNLGWQRLSVAATHGRRARVVLVDSMGELVSLYRVATFIFCGGSLVDRGGHNIIEAAACGRPVFYGPSMGDFADAAELLEAAGAGFPVRTPSELARQIFLQLDDWPAYEEAGRRGRQAALAQVGAAGRQARLALQALCRAEMPAEGRFG